MYWQNYSFHMCWCLHHCIWICPQPSPWFYLHEFLQGADPLPLPLRVAKTGRNHLNEEFTPLLPTGIGERFQPNLINLGHSAQWWAKWRLSTFDLYPWGEGHGVQGQICNILRPQLPMNRFLSLWPHRFPHFGYIHLGGGGVGGLWY